MDGEALEEVRVVGVDGVEIDTMPIPRAISLADKLGVKVKVFKQEDELSVYRFVQKEEIRPKGRKEENVKKVKEIRFSDRIAEHDVVSKVNKIRRFLEKGHPVSISIVSKEGLDRDLAEAMAGNITERVADIVRPELTRTVAKGRTFTCTLAPIV